MEKKLKNQNLQSVMDQLGFVTPYSLTPYSLTPYSFYICASRVHLNRDTDTMVFMVEYANLRYSLNI